MYVYYFSRKGLKSGGGDFRIDDESIMGLRLIGISKYKYKIEAVKILLKNLRRTEGGLL